VQERRREWEKQRERVCVMRVCEREGHNKRERDREREKGCMREIRECVR
jgi:hypothetical protein